MTRAAALPSDVLISLSCQRPRLVLDPWLCLDASGPLLIQRLQAFAELWVVRELWHILDNSHYFALHPQALVSEAAPQPLLEEYHSLFVQPHSSEREQDATNSGTNPARARELMKTLVFWDRIRLTSDLAGLKLFWMGDGLAESLLPEGSSPALHGVHEQLVQWFDRKLQPRSPIGGAQRDALALALALGGVPVLSLVDREGEAFGLPSSLASGPLECSRVPEPDRVVSFERDAWTSLLVRANCAPLLWNGLRLALVHVHAVASASVALCEASGNTEADALGEAAVFEGEPVKAYWYAL